MVRNKLSDLTNTLFAQLEALDDRDLTADELKTELQRSKQMVAISGQTPHNKGKKYPNMPKNSGQFKKGNRPPNYVPVSTINYTTDGYPKEKIGEPNQWVLKHRKVWEDHHGPIPKGYSIVFLDGDKTNYDISNLACLSKNEIARMNQNHLFTSNADLTKSGIGLTKLTNKIREVEKNG